jgi:hypothetical protein
MKNPPTLADAFVAFSLRPHIHSALAKLCRAMLPARKFVLDEAMSRYWADVESALVTKGSYRARLRMLNNIRILSRLPHALTWIEHDPRHYRARTIEKHGFEVKPGMRTQGWLIQQHPQIDTAFRCSQYVAHDDMDDLYLEAFASAWVVNDSTPMPWPRAAFPEEWMRDDQAQRTSPLLKTFGKGAGQITNHQWTDAELLSGMPGYLTAQVQLVEGMDHKLRSMFPGKNVAKNVWKMRAQCRVIWTLLSMINDLPVGIEHVQPSKGYVARGSYKRFLEHSVVHLTVETQWRKLIAKTAASLRRRAHQVRGHWRKDWRNPLGKSCEHDFDERMICRRCHGHQIWIAEHQRGDASLGFVLHDYQVHHANGGAKP